MGGKVVPAGDAGNREYGQSELTLTESSALLRTPDKQLVLMSHGDAVTEIPADFIRTGTSADCPFASIENPDKKIYGIQFHPEVRHSVHGYDILRNFALNICGAKGDWTMDNFIDMQIKKSVKPSETNVSFLVFQVVLTLPLLGFSFKSYRRSIDLYLCRPRSSS